MTVMNFEPMDAFITRWQNAAGKELCDCVLQPDSQEEENAIS
jgi:hypothetical protein